MREQTHDVRGSLEQAPRQRHDPPIGCGALSAANHICQSSLG
jgi:hypothetical protein